MISGLYLADTSLLSRTRSEPAVARRLNNLAEAGLLATCIVLDLEAGISATSPADHQLIAAQRRELLLELPNTPEVANSARVIQAALARASQHRAAGSFDVLIAAFGLTYGATILHRDGDYDTIAAITGQAVERV